MAQFFLWIVKGFGWVLLLIAFLVLLLLVFPLWVAVEVHYDRLTVKIHVLGLAIPVYPLPKKKKKYRPKHLKEKTSQPEESADLPKGEEESSEAPPPKEEKADTEQGERGKSGWWSPGRVFEIITTSGKLMRAFLRVMRIKKVQLVLPIAAEDAAQTAIQYGKMQAAVGSALGVLQNYFEIQIEKLQIIADFTGEYKYRRYFYCRIGATPFVLLAVCVSVLWKAYRKKHFPSGR